MREGVRLMKKKLIFFIAILISIIIIIIVKNNQSLKKETSNSLDLGVPIQVENVEFGNLTKSIHYTGLMESKSTVNISSKITAEILFFASSYSIACILYVFPCPEVPVIRTCRLAKALFPNSQ